ncbi:type II toxin-antitoxin system HicB family antitoxin [Patescibacteria group bacterium]|nr:type II toxin-antitoxin system HicB family antitoxin [Patescibacteria group bacterium]MBU4481676.1 type II toxin-antitoxin system HicB family antitoxin [Patescibacteria group bacterium]
MARQFTAIYKKSGKWYLGWVEEIPGVNTQGKTLREAKENLKEALLLILETNRFLNGWWTNEIGDRRRLVYNQKIIKYNENF